MVFFAKVVGGHYTGATINTNRKGELALSVVGFKRSPNLTIDAVAAWEEIVLEKRGGAAGAVSDIGQAVALAALRGRVGRAASAAVGSTVDSISGGSHTIRVDWVDGKQSLIQIPDKHFHHLSILLKDQQIATTVPDPAPGLATPESTEPIGMIGQLAQLAGMGPTAAPDVMEQIAKLATLRDQGALTEDEFSAKKADLLSRL